MTAPVFVDTNVLVYARDASEPAKQPAAEEWLRHLWRERLGRTSVQVLSEYYVTVTRKLRPGMAEPQAWDDVEAFMTWNPVPVDCTVIRRGREVAQRFALSWWDSLVVAAAQLQGCGLLLSEDLQAGASYDGVIVRSPFDLQVQEGLTTYGTELGPRPRHRSPGRPVRAR